MKKRSLRNGVIVVITLGALTGVGTMVASAGTRTDDGAATGGNSAEQRGDDADRQAGRNGAADPNGTQRPADPDASPSPFDPDADPNVDADRAAADTSACVAVQVRDAQGDDEARLCTTVRRTGLRVDRVRVSLTSPGDCRGSVTLRATTQQGSALTDTVPCADPATATFTPRRNVADGSQVCGVLAADDRFGTARACVRVTG
ncbi:hypothetical protein DMB66_30650 [Actinoplanes sp. ATCC 53533]|uniref:hypothetical protein n=1 Tax=Actinoplanes sp. ATCC 53533 TaxID=1288362 RepID=UPI000F786B1D|nr:hypothetical protein [Actinoplanes sp. ATCC 53533]RSM58060.1 hypothetical protein DMB66_30650 [Actinoplanes sp. ATCC 53533]